MEDKLDVPPKMRVHHELPGNDIIEHEASMHCLCEPYVTETVDAGEEGSVVVVKHHTFESTKPKHAGFYGFFGGLGWPDLGEDD